MVDEVREFDKFHPTEGEFALINKYTDGNIPREQLFVVKRKACNNKVDKHDEEFQDKALQTISKKIIGTPAIKNHNKWSVESVWGKNFDASVIIDKTEKGRFGREKDPVLKFLQVSQYTIRSEKNEELRNRLISRIEDAVSVCFSWEIEQMKCSICGKSIFVYDFETRQWECTHVPGRIYDDEKCFIKIMDIKDFYELSNVVIGAQYDTNTIFNSKSIEDGIKEYQELNENIKSNEWSNGLREKYLEFKIKTMGNNMKKDIKNEKENENQESNLETPENGEDKLITKEELNEVKKTVDDVKSEVNEKLNDIEEKISDLVSLSEDLAKLSEDVEKMKEIEKTINKMDEKMLEIEKSNSKLNENLETLKKAKFGNKTILSNVDAEENKEEGSEDESELIKAAKGLL